MKNSEIVNGIAAVRSVFEAFHRFEADVLDREAFTKASAYLIEQICNQNESLLLASGVHNGNLMASHEIGKCNIPLCSNHRLKMTIAKKLPALVNGDQITLPIRIDCSNCVRMLIQVDSAESTASMLAQYVLFSIIKQMPNIHFRCADMVSGGSFFSYSHSLIAQFPERSGGAVCTKYNDISDMLEILEGYSATAMNTIGGQAASVYEYNRSNKTSRIQEHVVVLRIQQSAHGRDEISRIGILMQNGLRNGMSFIVICDDDTAKKLQVGSDYCICMRGREMYYGQTARLPFSLSPEILVSEKDVSELIERIRSSEAIDTRYETHPELRHGYFTMESSQALRIPFGVDRNNVPQYFEIGGNAPSHALIAGSTGSGKSVLLHTLIMQIVYNYHPDDVEIWAIDYKSVEFDSYIDNRTPHFRMIANDTSDEFSLSFLDKIYGEYERRQRAFLSVGVKNINEYREKIGKRSMPRIIVFIDEFQMLTQAVQAYTGNKEYRTQLENLLRLTRAMGISLVLCSQTIASGLSGLTDAARDQIGCRICLKHDDDNEIRETLVLSGTDASEIIKRAKNLRRGQSIYKRARWANEHATDGKAYEFRNVHILHIDKETQLGMIDSVNAHVGNDYTPKEVVLVRGGGRIRMESKTRHPITKFVRDHYEPQAECVEWYPAAPTTLEDAYCLNIENTAGASILLIGEDDALRDSIVLHSVMGFLMNPCNRVIASFSDERNSDRERMIAQLRSIRCDRLLMGVGIKETLNNINRLKRIRPVSDGSIIYLWYGLDKLKNEIFLLNQDDEDENETENFASANTQSLENMIADCSDFFQSIISQSGEHKRPRVPTDVEALSYEDCQSILMTAFDVGPENNHFHFVIFNNRKAMKKSGLIKLENFENRIGTRMSSDDSYELFGSSLAVMKADESTVIYYGGSGSVVPLRPYLMPDQAWLDEYNRALSES